MADSMFKSSERDLDLHVPSRRDWREKLKWVHERTVETSF